MTDRRFGTHFKFGTSTKFGASSFSQGIVWGIAVDWNGDGVLDGTNEAINLCDITVDRGRTRMLKDAGDGLEQIAPGNVVLTLWNDDGRYDGWNASSPLFPNVSEGKDVWITVRDFATGAVKPVFYGTITNIVPTGYDSRPKVNIYLNDGWVFLRGYAANVNIQSAITPDVAIGQVLDAAGWPLNWGRSLDVASSDTIPYFWSSGDKKAGDVCEDIANAFFGNFFIDANGRARYITRSSVTASVADFDQSVLLKDIGNPQPSVNKRNVMRIKVHPRVASGTVVLYQLLGSAPIIQNGQSFPIWVNYTYNGNTVPAQSVVQPVPATDWTTNTLADGTGTDKTSQCTSVATNFGDRGKIVITNSSGSPVYLTKQNLQGVAIYEQNALDVFYPTDPTTVKRPRELVVDLLWQQNPNVAQDFCTVYGPFLSGAHPFPSIQVQSRFAYQFGIDLFDIVTLTSSRLGINGVAFRVGGISHKSDGENCQNIITTFYLEPYISGANYMTWDAVWDSTTIFGW